LAAAALAALSTSSSVCSLGVGFSSLGLEASTAFTFAFPSFTSISS